jgi:hypothetical protein
MSSAKRLIIASLATVSLATSAWACGSGASSNDDRNDPWVALSYKVHRPSKVWAPAVGVARATETLLHWPRIFAEACFGERPLVSRKGVLAPRETPIEDQIYSPGE